MNETLRLNEIDSVRIAYAIRQIDDAGILHDSVDIKFDGVSLVLQRYGVL